MIVPKNLVKSLAYAKKAQDINIGTFNQHAISALLDISDFKAYLQRVYQIYADRRDEMMRALAAHFPDGTVYSSPKHGLFIWVKLPFDIDTQDFLEFALDHYQVAFFPGQAFNSIAGKKDSVKNCMRLNFTQCEFDKIGLGIKKLAKALEAYK
jgi:DNA-binding transcriptional MocR family regulator